MPLFPRPQVLGPPRRLRRLVRRRPAGVPSASPASSAGCGAIRRRRGDRATVNPVDRSVLSARCRSARRKPPGSVPAEVAAQKPCTVAVVRPEPVDGEAAA